MIDNFIGMADFMREFENKFESNPSYNLWKYPQSLSGLSLDTYYHSKVRDDKKSNVAPVRTECIIQCTTERRLLADTMETIVNRITLQY